MARQKAKFACNFGLKWQIQDVAGSSMHNIAESEREKGNPERLSAYLCGGVNPEPVNAYIYSLSRRHPVKKGHLGE